MKKIISYSRQNKVSLNVHHYNFSRINKNGKIAINFKEDDELIAVRLTTGNEDILIGTAHASLIRLRPLGRTAAGVKGIYVKGILSLVLMLQIQKVKMKY